MRRLVILFLALVCAGGLQAQSGGYTAPTVVYSGPNGAYRAQTNSSGGVNFQVTDTTIVATGITASATTSSLTCGGKAAIDNGVAAASTSHQNIVVGLTANTAYSCSVTWGSFTSPAKSVTTAVAQTRTPVLVASLSTPTIVPNANHGDTLYTFVSNDNKSYITEGDGYGFVQSTPNAGANMQLGVLTNETTGAFAGTTVNLLTAYGAWDTTNGTDGPGGAAMTNKPTGLFSMAGNLYIFATRQLQGAYFNNIVESTNKGSTWNNYQATSTFNAAGSPINTSTFPLASNTYGWVSPVRYAVDDGTLGYNTAGNQIDGANGYVYATFVVSPFQTSAGQGTPAYMLRIPRVQLASLSYTGLQYWVGTCGTSCAATDFVNDSNWSSSDASKAAIFSPSPTMAWPVVTFVPAINYYILTGEAAAYPDSSHYTTFAFAGPTPVGPWTQIYTDGGNTQEYYGQQPFHRDVATNSLTDAIPVRLLFSGAAASFTTYYYPTFSTLTLKTSASSHAFVQGNGSTSGQTGTSFTLGYSSNVTAGNLLVVAWRRATGSTTVTGISNTACAGNANVVYDTADPSTTIGGGWGWCFATSTGSSTWTVNLSASTAGGVLVDAEYSGVSTLHATIGANTGTSLTPTSGSITATAGDLLIGVAEPDGQTTAAAGSGYTYRESGTSGGSIYVQLEDNLSATGGSTTASFTNTGNASLGWTAGIGAFH